jgi:predicted component of type VI protein secretion system
MLGDLTFLVVRSRYRKWYDDWYTSGVPHEPNGQAGLADDVRLEALKGPREGEVFSFSEGDITIGRDPSNRVPLLDPLVSRMHCVVRSDGAAFQILDLDSRNSTFVNGVAIKERTLAPGDQIRVGNSMFVLRGAEKGSSTSAVFGGAALDGASDLRESATFILRKEDALYLQTQASANLPATARTVRDLKVLVDFSRALNAIDGVAALEEKVLDAVLEVSPAERVALVRTEDADEGFAAVRGRDRRLGVDQPIAVSETILKRVLQENVAVVSNDIPGDEALRDA